MLGKPTGESSAHFVPTAIYPFASGGEMAWRATSGTASSPLCELGWKSLGILELTALPTIRRESDAEFDLEFVPDGSDMGRSAGTALGLIQDFTLFPHLGRDPDTSLATIEKWASTVPVPT